MQATSPTLGGLRAGSPDPTLPSLDYQPTTRIVFGVGALARLGEVARELGGTRPLLVTDPGLWAAGHPQRAAESLRAAGLEVIVFDAVEENPTTRHVAAALETARTGRIDLIVAVGGGSSMDCAKGVNFLLTNGGAMTDYKGFGKATKPMLPSIAVPTTAGTGSEGQSFALIADEKTHLKMACGDRKAAFRVALLDPALTVSQPRQSRPSPPSTPCRTPWSPTSPRAATRCRRCSRGRRGAFSTATSRRCCGSRATSTPAAPCRLAPTSPASPSRTRCSASATPAPTR